MLGTLSDIQWDQRTAIVSCEEGSFGCALRELRRHFELGDAVRIIAGPFSGEAGYVVSVHDNSITLSLMQDDGNSETVRGLSQSVHSCPNKIHRLKFRNCSYRAACKTMYWLASQNMTVQTWHRIHSRRMKPYQVIWFVRIVAPTLVREGLSSGPTLMVPSQCT